MIMYKCTELVLYKDVKDLKLRQGINFYLYERL